MTVSLRRQAVRSNFRAAPGRGMHAATARLRALRAGVFGAFTGASSTRVGEFDNVGTNGKNDVVVEGKVTRVRVVADVGQCQATVLDSAVLGGKLRPQVVERFLVQLACTAEALQTRASW